MNTAVSTDTVRIFDTTLRDGEQSPGCSMSPQQKVVMARALAELGVDIIETGFPASSESDRQAMALIGREVRTPTLAVLSRCLAGDIEISARALEAAANPRLHVFLSTSPLHREHKLRMSKEQVLESVHRHVTLARGYVDDVEFSAEDATPHRDRLPDRGRPAPPSPPARGPSTCPIPSASPPRGDRRHVPPRDRRRGRHQRRRQGDLQRALPQRPGPGRGQLAGRRRGRRAPDRGQHQRHRRARGQTARSRRSPWR